MSERRPESDWVTVAVLQDEVDTALQEGLLKDNGIECHIHPSASHPYPSVSKFKINVRRRDVDKARRILAPKNRGPETKGPDDNDV